MPAIDYMKVMDVAALTMEITSHIEVNALDLNLFKAKLSPDNGGIFEILMKINEFDLELSIEKESMDDKAFKKWLPKFEFQLEQEFLKNITLNYTENKKEYKIKIIF